MYEDFYGLSEKPFSIQPDPSFLYWGRGHRLAYAMLEYGVLNHAGISLITGEVGCGKTTLVHRLLDQLGETHTVALLSNIQQGRGDLLSWVLMAFGQAFADKDHVEKFAELQRYFISEYAKGRRVVLIIDEAQNLSIDMLEELRMLSNINAGKDQLLQLILVGQPQLKEILNRPDMLQFAQRIGSDFHLTPLSREEVRAYLETRLTIAGAPQSIFKNEAADLIADTSRGVPRVINILADTALVYGFSAGEQSIGRETIEQVIRDKGRYGVFGIASDDDLEMPEEQVSGPGAMLNGAGGAGVRAAASVADSESGEPQAAAASVVAMRREPASALVSAEDTLYPDLRRPVDARFLTARGANGAAPAADMGVATSTRPQALGAATGEGAIAEAAEAAAPAAGVVGVIIYDAAPSASPASAMNTAPDDALVYYAARAGAMARFGDAARAGGAERVEVRAENASLGRVLNAAYRRLRKAEPDLALVQFVPAGGALDAGWINAARGFLTRRPEVTVLEGVAATVGGGPVARALALAETDAEAGEINIVGDTFMVRAEEFESAGGFRSDIPGVEIADLCVRLRKRGARAWRVETPMAKREPRARNFREWMTASRRRGADIARGAALHGAPPEQYAVADQARAMIWGGLAPAFFIFAALFGALGASTISASTPPWAIVAGVAFVGLVVYGLAVTRIAFRYGAKRAASWRLGVLTMAGRFAECAGLVDATFKRSPRRAKRA